MSTLADRPGLAAEHVLVELTYRQAINAALEDEMVADSKVVLLGEDVTSSGGVFKTNDGLLEQFGPARIRNTPICENTFVGAALGMAVTGLRPVVEIMFSDFIPTAGDAIVNEVAKFRFMSGGQCKVPLTIRSIGGATGRFGTQHSATGESWLLQATGLKVATAGSPSSAYANLRAAIRDPDPVVFFEHKALYGKKGPVLRADTSIARVGSVNLMNEGADVTVVATLLMASRAAEVAEELAVDGIGVEVLELGWLRPLDFDAVESSLDKTRRLVVVEEQVHVGGWGASLISEVARRGLALKECPVAVSIADDVLIPYAPPLEDAVIPSKDRISAAIRGLVG
jgi:pyruvate dehydrogenase E1 component beta subunit